MDTGLGAAEVESKQGTSRHQPLLLGSHVGLSPPSEVWNGFDVTLPNRTLPAIDLSRSALDATFLVLREAIMSFSVMPLSTFLPANMWARLAVEVLDRATQSVAWLAINDAMRLDVRASPSKAARGVSKTRSDR